MSTPKSPPAKPSGPGAKNSVREHCRRRAAKLARLWGLREADARLAVECETSMQILLRQCGCPLDIVARVQLVKIDGNVFLDERALNDVPAAKMILLRANIGNLMGWMP